MGILGMAAIVIGIISNVPLLIVVGVILAVLELMD